ncbi:hypothetical protein MM817_03011 [Acidibacillus sp. S0AB]|uniref:Major facilitator superfamily (MFS) profile domain-containing protein n=1 Tax=Sulfoacidibacillus ferrooxidans TaxID=2005001 RepID=A0A9X1VC52_9BACL|nr:hypothetical protein [Sulfoacidibacillus ferrooxidans]
MPLAGRWYDLNKQGLVLGLVGAGNTGTLLATFFAGRIAKSFGWHVDFAVALFPLFIVLLLLLFWAREAPRSIHATTNFTARKGVFTNRDA